MNSATKSLKFRVISAGVWASFVGIAGTVLRFGSSLIMTRLLFPDAFGLLAIGAVTSMLLNLFSDIGIRQFVINHERGHEQKYLDSVWGMSVIRGAMIMLGGIVAAGVIAACNWFGWFGPDSVYGHPDLPAIIAMTSISSLILGFKSPKLYVLERNLDLRKLAYLELAAQLAGTLVTIALAWWWRNVWSVVAGGYITAIVSVLLSFQYANWDLGRLRWDRSIVAEVVRYGRWILLSSATSVIAANLDRLMLGFWVAPAALGLYTLALNIVGMVDGIASRPFMAVAMPAFSEVVRRGDGKLKSVYLRVRLPFDLLTVTAAGAVFATAQLMVQVLYDDRYADAGRSLQILSFSLLFLRYNITGTAHVSLGEPRTASISSVIKLVAIALAIPVGYSLGGYFGAVWAISLHMLPATLYLLWMNGRHGLNDFWFEARMLLAWPAGYALGWVANKLAGPVLSLLGLG